jgi:hypothetical protein
LPAAATSDACARFVRALKHRRTIMIMRHERISEPSTGLAGAAVAGLRVVIAGLAGLVLMLGALLFAVVLGGVVVLWKLLRGRRGRMAYFGWRGGRTRSRPGATQGDVIDVEVREVAMRGLHKR